MIWAQNRNKRKRKQKEIKWREEGEKDSERKSFNLRPGSSSLFSVSTDSAQSAFPLVLTDGWRPFSACLCLMHSWDTLKPQPLLFWARSSLFLLSAAIWCGEDRLTKTGRESEPLKEEGKKENQEMADETDLCPVLKGQVGEVGLRSERGKGGQGGSLGRGCSWNMKLLTDKQPVCFLWEAASAYSPNMVFKMEKRPL